MIKFKKHTNIKNSEPTYGELRRGDCFVHEGDIYIKISATYSNAVRLSDGDHEWAFENGDIVVPVVLKAKVKRRLS